MRDNDEYIDIGLITVICIAAFLLEVI